MTGTLRVTSWAGPGAPSRSALSKLMADEGLSPYSWSNGPFDVYAAHSHTYDKVIYVVQGGITFGLPDQNREVSLNPGDRLDLPAGLVHNATVGAQGVTCLEAHR